MPEGYPQLLSLAVHEFRTPASVVGGYLRMLQRDIGDPLTDRQLKMLDEAEKSCAKLVSLIAQLSEISKLDSGQLTLSRQPLDVFVVAGEVAERMPETGDRGVRLVARGQAAGALVEGDAARLGSAIDAIARAILREKIGPCTVAMERRIDAQVGRRSAVIVIADENDVASVATGASQAFDDTRGGLGLALPLAHRVITGHGGSIWSPGDSTDGDRRARGSAVIALPIRESQS